VKGQAGVAEGVGDGKGQVERARDGRHIDRAKIKRLVDALGNS
jgi:hypothetical protein